MKILDPRRSTGLLEGTRLVTLIAVGSTANSIRATRGPRAGTPTLVTRKQLEIGVRDGGPQAGLLTLFRPRGLVSLVSDNAIPIG